MDIPRRHQSYITCCRKTHKLRWLVNGDPCPSNARWQALGEGLNRGDPLADKLILWLESCEDSAAAMQAFNQASKHGIDHAKFDDLSIAEPFINFFKAVEAEPEWLNRGLLDEAALFFDRAFPAHYYVLRNAGLTAGYLARDLNKPLIMTGALSGGSRRRFAQTMKWSNDCMALGGLNIGAAGYRSTLHVRLLHARIRRHLSQHDDWDHDDMGLPINQTDMVATWLAFAAIGLGGIRAYGVPVSKRESKAVMHFWKYACWLLGVDIRWLSDDENEARILLFQILSSYRDADESSATLATALINDVTETRFKYEPAWLRKLETFKHLSSVRLFAGHKGTQQLGLNPWVPPIYPLACIPLNLSKHGLAKAIPPFKRFVEKRGRAGRKAQLAAHFGEASQDLAAIS